MPFIYKIMFFFFNLFADLTLCQLQRLRSGMCILIIVLILKSILTPHMKCVLYFKESEQSTAICFQRSPKHFLLTITLMCLNRAQINFKLIECTYLVGDCHIT